MESNRMTGVMTRLRADSEQVAFGIGAMVMVACNLGVMMIVYRMQSSLSEPLPASVVASLAPGSCERQAVAKLVAANTVATGRDLEQAREDCAAEAKANVDGDVRRRALVEQRSALSVKP
jgi:hypothetical protein